MLSNGGDTETVNEPRERIPNEVGDDGGMNCRDPRTQKNYADRQDNLSALAIVREDFVNAMNGYSDRERKCPNQNWSCVDVFH